MHKRILNFGTPTCTGCKSLAPFLEAVARRHGVEVVKYDLEQDPGLAMRYAIGSLPTLIYQIVDGGQVRDYGRSVGFSPRTLKTLQDFAEVL
jgi:thiol-disulfide isomerase/thioredoxin